MRSVSKKFLQSQVEVEVEMVPEECLRMLFWQS